MATRLSEDWLVRDLGNIVSNEEPFETTMQLQLSKMMKR
jgi:hypothetical protein